MVFLSIISGYFWIRFIDQNGLEFVVLWPPLPNCWGYKYVITLCYHVGELPAKPIPDTRKILPLTYIPSPTKLPFKIDPILLIKCKLKQFVNENKILGRWAVQVTSFIPHFAKISLLAYLWFDFCWLYIKV